MLLLLLEPHNYFRFQGYFNIFRFQHYFIEIIYSFEANLNYRPHVLGLGLELIFSVGHIEGFGLAIYITSSTFL